MPPKRLLKKMLSSYDDDNTVPARGYDPSSESQRVSSSSSSNSAKSTDPDSITEGERLRLDLDGIDVSNVINQDPNNISHDMHQILTRREEELTPVPPKKNHIDPALLARRNRENYEKLVTLLKEEYNSEVDYLDNQWGCIVYTDVFGTQRALWYNNLTGSVYTCHWKYVMKDSAFENILRNN